MPFKQGLTRSLLTLKENMERKGHWEIYKSDFQSVERSFDDLLDAFEMDNFCEVFDNPSYVICFDDFPFISSEPLDDGFYEKCIEAEEFWKENLPFKQSKDPKKPFTLNEDLNLPGGITFGKPDGFSQSSTLVHVYDPPSIDELKGLQKKTRDILDVEASRPGRNERLKAKTGFSSWKEVMEKSKEFDKNE